jgi:hypothetical protein
MTRFERPPCDYSEAILTNFPMRILSRSCYSSDIIDVPTDVLNDEHADGLRMAEA